MTPLWNPFHVRPAPRAFGTGKILPECCAKSVISLGRLFGPYSRRFHSWLSRITFSWVNPLLNVGFSRPLEEDGTRHLLIRETSFMNLADLWEMPDSHLTHRLTEVLEVKFYSRCPPKKRPWILRERLPAGISVVPDVEQRDPKDLENTISATASSRSRRCQLDSNTSKARQNTFYDESLFRAIHNAFFVRIWIAGMLNFCAGEAYPWRSARR